MNLSKATDEQLVRQYQKNKNSRALGLLFKRYAHLVLGLCLNYLKHKEDAQDAVMDIFEKIAAKLKDSKVQNFKKWLYSVSKNHCLNQIRDRLKVIYREIQEKELMDFMENDPETGLIIDQNMEVINNGVNQLKPDQRNCITLFYYKNLSYKQIAEEVGFSESKVKSHIQNGKRNLKIYLSKQLS